MPVSRSTRSLVHFRNDSFRSRPHRADRRRRHAGTRRSLFSLHPRNDALTGASYARPMRTLLVAAALASTLVGSVAAASSAAKPRTLATRGPVIALAADGDRAALVVAGRRGCASVVVWEATRRRVVRFRSAARCESGDVSVRESTDAVVLAGTRVAWIESGGGLSHQWQVNSATLARPTPRELASGVLSDGGDGTLASGLVGDGPLLASFAGSPARRAGRRGSRAAFSLIACSLPSIRGGQLLHCEQLTSLARRAGLAGGRPQ